MVAGLLALGLGLAVLPLAKGSVDDALADEARDALAARGVDGVSTASDWARLTLSGPAELRDLSLAAVENASHRSAMASVVYAGATGAAAGPSAGPSPTVPSFSGSSAPVSVGLTFSGSGAERRIELTGEVPSEADHRALVAAAVGAYGRAAVTDRLVVGGGAGSAAGLAAVEKLIGVFGPTIAEGTASFDDGVLDVDAVAVSTPAARSAAAAMIAARTEGFTGTPIKVIGFVQPPPASASEVGAVQQTVDEVLRGNGITFQSASATLTSEARARLDRISLTLRATPGTRVTITGHTDGQGAAAANLTLSRRRAETVRSYLAGHGVGAERLTTAGRGESEPVAGNGTAAGRQANRRIDFAVQGA